MPWRGATVCESVIAAAEEAGLAPVVVAGYRAAELSARLSERPGLTLAVNDRWESGMLGSIIVGARAARDRFGAALAGFVVAPADMPLIPASAFKAVAASGLAAAGLASADPAAVFASKDGRLGHPVYIPAEFIPLIESSSPSGRLRDILLAGPWGVAPVDDEGIFIDLDTPGDYEAKLAALRGG